MRPEAGSKRRFRRQESEARILAAAEEIFAETGFSGATTAMIAKRARLPKANVHYYFGTKERLYRTVLERILEAWLASGDSIRPDADPAAALTAYVAAKVEASRTPALRLQGVRQRDPARRAAALGLSARVRCGAGSRRRRKVIDQWAKRGLIAAGRGRASLLRALGRDPDLCRFRGQVRAVLGRERLQPADYRAGAALITRMALAACGIAKP